MKGDWDAWNARSLAEEPIIRVILDGTVVRVRLDRRATSIVLLVVLGVREDGQKVLLAIKNMGGETSEAWRVVLDDLVKRGLRRPEFLIVDGGSGLEQALAGLWGDVPTQRCTVHKHRNLLAHAPQRLHEAVSADYNDMIYAASAAEIEERRRAFIGKWRLKCRRWPTASRKPVIGSSLLPGCRSARVEDWRAGLGRRVSTAPRFQPPPRRTQRADFPHCAPHLLHVEAYWTYPVGATFGLSRRTR